MNQQQQNQETTTNNVVVSINSKKKEELPPLQTPMQELALDIHALIMMVADFCMIPITWLLEQVDAGTSSFRKFNK